MKVLHLVPDLVEAAYNLCLPLLHGHSLSKSDLDVVTGIATARTSHECNESFWLAGERFEVGKFACGEIDLEKRNRAVFFGMQWTEAWRKFYLENDFLKRDPLIGFLADTTEPFTWNEQIRGTRMSAEDKAIFRLVADQGWVDGFVLPVQRTGSHVGLVSAVCRRALDPERDKPFLTCISFCYFERMRAIVCSRDLPVAPMGLSPRELECLTLVAAGNSDRAIGSKLGISTSTAHEHVQRAMMRIGVSSRLEAVAIATEFGVFRPC